MEIQGVGRGVTFQTVRKGSKAGNWNQETKRPTETLAEGRRGIYTARNTARDHNRKSSRRCAFCVMNGEEAVWHTFKVCAMQRSVVNNNGRE